MKYLHGLNRNLKVRPEQDGPREGTHCRTPVHVAPQTRLGDLHLRLLEAWVVHGSLEA